LLDWDYGELCGGTEGAVGLCPVTPHRTSQPLGRNAVSDLIDTPGPIAVRDDARIRHAEAKCVLALLDVTRVYSGCSDPNTNFP
jgi:hypothetical protein